ncbi:hypothetical protein GCM10025883_41170 [Mobilicoccus caccae]|uniref:HTH araC/xylS-type domain-containing protein n=1 Tax=Mobilicoccus caccae TaxID=1859295 RepID=A0ABQ6IVY4_9MICO|nr:hypothetical protein GCM10025883_41170 [Mobilicoccus caccae]
MTITHLDREGALRAVAGRDTRFDGWFVTAVLTTGIYCRPSCPAMTPRAANVDFYPTAAAAQLAGFRACKRCRPDASPGSPEWDTRADVVARAMRLIADGIVDREGVPGLARALGYSVRQVERVMRAELGAGPLSIVRARRAQTARTLVESTSMPLADAAFAAGFSSVRAFNDTVRQVYATTPSDLRMRASATPGRTQPARARPDRSRRGVCTCGCPSGVRSARTTCSVISSRPACPGWRSGGAGPIAARSACRAGPASSRFDRRKVTSRPNYG